MEFDAPPSTAAAWMPALFAITLLPFAALLPILWSGPASALVVIAGVALALSLLLLAVWRRLKQPMRYQIVRGSLIVPAHFQPVRVSLANARVTVGPGSGWRVAGTAIPPFLLGTFADRHGLFHAAATAEAGVWVHGDRRVFVSPADTPAFVTALVDAGANPPGNLQS